MIVLGVHFPNKIHDHDPGAALVRDGQLIAVCEEERFNRVKTSRGYLPIYSIRQALNQGGISIHEVDRVVASGETDPHAEQRLALILRHYFGYSPPVTLINHQLAHLSSAFYASGYATSMVVSYDGSGDALSCVLAKGTADGIEFLETQPFTNSLGNFYELITQFLGFEASGGEYKVMGLAPYGKPGIDLSGFIRSTPSGYRYDNERCYRSELPFSSIDIPFYSDYVLKTLGEPRRVGEPISQRHKDIAHAAQHVLEESVVALIKHLHRLTGLDSLCLAGGVALNCSANLKISRLPFLRNLFIQPAASDRGLALGCALWGAKQAGELPPPTDIFRCGPDYSEDQIRQALDFSGYRYEVSDRPERRAAELLADDCIIGWFQGRSEYGPRALGHRSILANPKKADVKERINSRIKFREEFRPFAPAIIEEAADDYFDMGMLGTSPHMTVAVPVRESRAAEIVGVRHVNNTGRVQTVGARTDRLFHGLISRFGELTDTPVVVNTSFNIKGQPIVESPMDALSTFASCGLEALVIGNFVVRK